MNDIFQLKRLDPVNIKYLTRLERAIFTGDNRTVKALEKEDVNRSNSKYGFNAFLYAVELGDITIVRELMQRKKSVDLSLVDDKGRNSLMIAVIYGHKDIIMFLLKEVNVKIGCQDNNGHTALK
jgi:ankyrin repeat protein